HDVRPRNAVHDVRAPTWCASWCGWARHAGGAGGRSIFYLAADPPRYRTGDCTTEAMTIKKWLARGLLAFILLVLLYQLWIFLHICWWIGHNPSSTALMDDRLAVLREDNPSARLKHKWVDYKKISTHLKRAVIASED